MDNSPLAKLPAEIRTMIYNFTFACSPVHVVRAPPVRRKLIFRAKKDEHIGALLVVCKGIRQESLKSFYRFTPFIVHINHFAVYQENTFDKATARELNLAGLAGNHHQRLASPFGYGLDRLRHFEQLFSRVNSTDMEVVPHLGTLPMLGISGRHLPETLRRYALEVKNSVDPFVNRRRALYFTLAYEAGSSIEEDCYVKCSFDIDHFKASLLNVGQNLLDEAKHNEPHRRSLIEDSKIFGGGVV